MADSGFKLLGIPYLVGKIKFKLFFQGPGRLSELSKGKTNSLLCIPLQQSNIARENCLFEDVFPIKNGDVIPASDVRTYQRVSCL